MKRKALLKHLWANAGDGQVCTRCSLVRREGAHGPRGGKGWSYYRNGGFVSFQTNNSTQIKCEPNTAVGIAKSLEALRCALAVRPGHRFRARAWELAETSNRADNMRAFVDELHRVAIPWTSNETVSLPGDQPPSFDADDACLFVAALAGVIGIPCRFVAARIGKRSWTVFLAYEDEDGFWVGVDVLRERADVIIEEIVL